MSSQLHAERAAHKKEDHEGIENVPIKPQDNKASENSDEAKSKAEAFDDLLDEIDAVLEEDSQAFVDGFIQRGGQ